MMSDITKVDFSEAMASQLPFVELLLAMGYRYVSRDEAMRERGGDSGNCILRETARRKLAAINSYEREGRVLAFADKDVEEAIDDLEHIPLKGVVDTSKDIYGMLMPTKGGKTVQVAYEGQYRSENFRCIDFDDIANNDFAVTVEYAATGKQHNIRVDIVVFVNGIPMALVENKKPSVGIGEAINQHNRNVKPDHCPKLFTYAQLMVVANSDNYEYGTLATPEKFYARWRERDDVAGFEQRVQALIATPVDANIYQTLLADLNANSSHARHEQALDRLVIEQDRGVVGMFEPSRLLDICKHFILYDAGIKKVMRYQQYFAIKKTLTQVSQWEDGVGSVDGSTQKSSKRKGGIIWHTQGSGKSLTMVMLVKALIEDPTIVNPRVLVVTDRRDLDRQIRDTFRNAGLKKKVIQASSGNHVLELIRDKDLAVVTTLVQKFRDASAKVNFVRDEDANIFVLIDEAHRSQAGDANLEMNKVIPNACYLAFTGTPLLKDNKSAHKFGSFIDKYTIDDALQDEIVLPLIYQGRYVDIEQNAGLINRKFERLANGLDDKTKRELERDTRTEMLASNPSRIEEIAVDIQKHYEANFAGTGLKAQIVAPSKFAAVMFKKYFDAYTGLDVGLVLSDENGIISQEDEHKQEVSSCLNDIKADYKSLSSYEKDIIDKFKTEDSEMELIIVVDKLLTGFDAPRNTVLYLAKSLKDHNLLQAIARVNRLYDNEKSPKTAGYIVDYSENAQNIKSAMELFGNYNQEDVQGTLINLDDKVTELTQAYDILNHRFKGLKNENEVYLQQLSAEDERKAFYAELATLTRLLRECQSVQGFAHEFPQQEQYKKDLKGYYELRKQTSLRYADKMDITKLKYQLNKILDEHITADEAEALTQEVVITDKEAFEVALQGLGSDNTKSQAAAIVSQMQRSVVESEERDPVFYAQFSQKISALIEAMRDKKLADIESLKIARKLYEEMLEKSTPEDDTQNSGLSPVQDLFYRNLMIKLEKTGVDDDAIKKISIEIVALIQSKLRVDWHKHPEAQREVKNALDDYIYETLKMQRGLDLDNDVMEALLSDVINLATLNYELFAV